MFQLGDVEGRPAATDIRRRARYAAIERDALADVDGQRQVDGDRFRRRQAVRQRRTSSCRQGFERGRQRRVAQAEPERASGDRRVGRAEIEIDVGDIRLCRRVLSSAARRCLPRSSDKAVPSRRRAEPGDAMACDGTRDNPTRGDLMTEPFARWNVIARCGQALSASGGLHGCARLPCRDRTDTRVGQSAGRTLEGQQP